MTSQAPGQAPGRKAPPDLWLAQTLQDAGLLLGVQAEEVRQGDREGEESRSVWERAVQRGYASNEAIVQALAAQFKVKPADLDAADLRASALLPESVARKHRVVPLAADDRTITLATADPRDMDLEGTLSFVTGRRVTLQVAPPEAIARKIDEAYRPEKTINALLNGLSPASLETIEEVDFTSTERDPALDAPMTRLVDAMISDGVREGASDIHAEPLSDGTSVRYRIDGVLKEVMRLPPNAGPALVRRVKILAKLDVTDPLHPHDGRAGVRVDGKVIDLRIATVPVARRGEKVVIRILDKANLRANIPDLNLPQNEELLFRKFIGHREGMVLVTGPTGSGKTTTLYAALNELRTGKVNIITVEDPVEYDVPGLSQLQVNEAQGFTFATALRSVLRQDPDILLVGEIRDAETADIAIQAGLTGHLVLSTLHTNDAPSAVVRMRDLGTDGFKLAAVLKGIVAQRLVRRVCAACAVPVSVEELPKEARPPEGREASPMRAVGCKACGGTGYRGRLAILEMMPVNDTIAHLIEAGALTDALIAAARPLGMRTLWESALERVWLGHTDLAEAVRVLGHHGEDEEADAPVAEAVPASVRAVVSSDSDAKPRVLVADDDPQMRRLIRSILERDGYLVTEAGDGLDALDQVESHPFDLMLLDIDMPRLDGLGVLEELRARIKTSGVPVIVLTARTDDTETRVLDLGAQDFLSKPVQPNSLQARVKAVLRRAKLA
ncbi:MAG TPA: ATPase, T2SS/T4P/T4SS family [Gemmatimonadales bacterium]|jgi:type II secretory ATPase GspE/PulE/Tfp pilus assembly ATPase PilB-like protein/ActR/RegA family two-component response regulator|nr:ATPase, T2SS/T4P/T4SS family [Gemmatimonadales bacterium]